MQTNAAQELASTVKDGFTKGVSFLQRRFSSSDLTEDTSEKSTPATTTPFVRPSRPPPPSRRQTVDLSTENSTTVSAPTSPAPKNQPKADSTQNTNDISHSKDSTLQRRFSYNPDRCKCLLVIDEGLTNWTTYFKGRKLVGDWDIRVEQTDFRGILMITSNVDGCFIHTINTKMAKIDFALIRQCPRDNDKWRKIIAGLIYGGVPGVNSMQSVSSFADRTLVFSNLLMLERKFGRAVFPLIEQSYTLGCDQLISAAPIKYPVVVKVGQGSKGAGKMKIQNPTDLLDLESVLSLNCDFATVEPHVDVAYEMNVQKIGAHYKTVRKKQKNSYWKNSHSTSAVEQIPTDEKHKIWIDEVSQMFGGLDICSLSSFVAADGSEYIYKVSDSTYPLAADCKEDVQLIADLVHQKMNNLLNIKMALQRRDSNNVIPHNQPLLTKKDSFDSTKRQIDVNPGSRPPPPPPPNRRNSSGIEDPPKRQPVPTAPPPPLVQGVEEFAEDTMGNLKKTFAGIFGDM